MELLMIIYKIKKGSVPDESGAVILTSEQVCQRIFQEVDVNNDGQITLEEFVEGAQRSAWLQGFLKLDINPNGYVQKYMCDRKLEAGKDS
ncbi:guanylyl cyclase-activating protein 2-like [Notolabrus celidotus]|uniref:guanylyl cyclase-activating protein 2-like n=1 Tax=Notolabrus celidotus TaxID=1203425 RepID=UPI00148F6376|nr:guanylyl cyclase-activating protein 2-like [Notolabrus celidotus]